MHVAAGWPSPSAVPPTTSAAPPTAWVASTTIAGAAPLPTQGGSADPIGAAQRVGPLARRKTAPHREKQKHAAVPAVHRPAPKGPMACADPVPFADRSHGMRRPRRPDNLRRPDHLRRPIPWHAPTDPTACANPITFADPGGSAAQGALHKGAGSTNPRNAERVHRPIGRQLRATGGQQAGGGLAGGGQGHSTNPAPPAPHPGSHAASGGLFGCCTWQKLQL